MEENIDKEVKKEEIKSKEGVADIIEGISVISEEIKNSSDEKPWWTSKVILVNIGALAVMLTAYFGLDLKSQGIDVKGIVEIATLLLPMVNIWLRSNSKQQIKKEIIPEGMKVAMTNSVSMVKAKFTRG